MPWYGRDFYGDEAVKLMTDRQEAWYHRLLWHQWEHGSIPDDLMSWFAIAHPEIGPDDLEWEAFARQMDRLFPPSADGRRRNTKNAEVREKHETIREVRSHAGKLGAEAVWAQRRSGKRMA
jgi:hypothetical protein